MRVKTSREREETEPVYQIPDTFENRFIIFAESRRLEPEFLAGLGVHVCPDNGDRPGWIAFPYTSLSHLWYHRYRNPSNDGGQRYHQPGSGTHLYNPLHLGPNADQVWFCEGEVDALTAIRAGLPAIGVPGVGISQKIFEGSWRLLFDTATVVVAFDDDEAGRAASLRLAEAFAPRSFVFDVFPDGVKDLNEWWCEDAEGMEEAVSLFKEGMKQ